MTEAISYKRFSSTIQLGGDSLRRQIVVTEAYCKRQGLNLIDSYFDPGVSGFNGANLNDGTALRALLDAAWGGSSSEPSCNAPHKGRWRRSQSHCYCRQ